MIARLPATSTHYVGEIRIQIVPTNILCSRMRDAALTEIGYRGPLFCILQYTSDEQL